MKAQHRVWRYGDLTNMFSIELSNGYVIHEHRMAPNGTGGTNLFLYTNE